MAQFGSAPDWGSGGRGFKSRRPDSGTAAGGGGRRGGRVSPTTGEPMTDVRDRDPADRILTIPNALSVLRLLGVPLFLWLLLGPAGRRRRARRAHGRRGHRLLRRQDRPLARPDQPDRRAARPGRRPALHPRHAVRLRRPRHHPVVAGRADRRPGPGAGADRAAAAPARLRPAAGQLPRQGGHLQPAVRVPAAADRRARLGGLRRRPAGRVGVRHLGDRALPVVRRRSTWSRSSSWSGRTGRSRGHPAGAG